MEDAKRKLLDLINELGANEFTYKNLVNECLNDAFMAGYVNGYNDAIDKLKNRD